MEKESMSSVVKKMACALKTIVKRKTRALKARLIVYSLLAQTNFFVSSIPLTTLTAAHQNQYCSQAQALEAEALQTEAEAEGENNGGCGSVIEMVKNSKEEAGEEFSLENDIDHVAELFITNFHRQMRMQKQNSINRYHQMLFDATL